MRFSGWASAALVSLATLLVPVAAQETTAEGYKTVPLRTHSLYSPYLDSDLQSRWFDWGGDTIIRADQYIRLASDRQGQKGYIWSRLPLTVTNWEIEMEFKIHGHGNLFGDGMALWITKNRAVQGPVFGSADRFEGLGIFFDTYKNNRPGVIFPYVMAMVGDGNKNYDHSNDGKDQELAGCSARGIRGASIPTKAKLTYILDQYLQLDLQYKSENVWTRCFRVENVKLPTVAYLGVTAETGELSDNFDIISISTKNLYAPKATTGAPNTSPKRPSGKTTKATSSGSSGGWFWWLLKMIFWMGVIVAAFVVYNKWRQGQRRARF